MRKARHLYCLPHPFNPFHSLQLTPVLKSLIKLRRGSYQQLVMRIEAAATIPDVPSTRSHWYPKWIVLAPVSIPIDEFAVVRRTTLGQEASDLVISTGVGIPVRKRHEKIADAVGRMVYCAPDYLSSTLLMLANPDQHPGGWEDFLLVIARREAGFFHQKYLLTDRSNMPADAEEFVHTVAEAWKEWYQQNRMHQEANCGKFGSEFIAAIKETEQVTKAIAQLKSGRLINFYGEEF
jgi:hypothetical protein